MTEKRFWTRILRPVLHAPPSRLAYKVQDAFVKGLPDVVALQEGDTYWIELKTLDHAPVRDSTPWRIGVTTEQRRWLTAWNRTWATAWEVQYADAAGFTADLLPPAFVLLWVDREQRWYALDPAIPESVDQSDFPQYILAEGDRETLIERLFDHGTS